MITVLLGKRIQELRKKTGLSQEKFAKEIGVSFATINRWERGLNEPNYEGQKAIHEFCKKNNIKIDD